MGEGHGAAPPVLQLDGVVKDYGEGEVRFRVLPGVDLTLRRGEFAALMGPSGSGKSTLLSLIGGLSRPTSGTVTVAGIDLGSLGPNRLSDFRREYLGFVFQSFHLIPTMTAIENVMTGAYLRDYPPGVVRAKAEEILRFTGLIERRDVPGPDLTIADKKRLEVAMALATRPTLLMLDEAMAGLTPVELREIIALLRKVRESGVTLIIVEHVMEAVMELSDRVVVITSGRKIVEGTPAEVVRNPEVIQAYLGERYHA